MNEIDRNFKIITANLMFATANVVLCIVLLLLRFGLGVSREVSVIFAILYICIALPLWVGRLIYIMRESRKGAN